MFLRNCWYLAAWADEIPVNGMHARRIAGEFVLMLRDAEGLVWALADTCPHRLVPLSKGRFENGVVTCGYHGLGFAPDGRCVGNPHGSITKALTVRRFGCVERHAAIWIWIGNAEPDSVKIPAWDFIDRVPSEARVKGYLYTLADYRLMVDNIMDLTHADFLHAASLGGGINTRARAETSQASEAITITWTANDDVLCPLHAQALGVPYGTRGDFYNQVRWEAPGNMLQRIIMAKSGELDTKGTDSQTCHVMTPETETSTHYFFCLTGDTVSANPAIGPLILKSLMAAFGGEDAPMLAAQSNRIGGKDFWALKPTLLPSDKGAALARRALDRMLAEERGPA